MHGMFALMYDVINESKEEKRNENDRINNEQQTRFKSVFVNDYFVFHEKSPLYFVGEKELLYQYIIKTNRRQ